MPLFFGKLGKLQEPVFYVDGFAGQGKLDGGSEGSALIAAKVAADPPQKSRVGILHCINVEPDKFVDGFTLRLRVLRNRWQGRRVQLRDVLEEIVKEFKWQATRVEWMKALRQCEASGLILVAPCQRMAKVITFDLGELHQLLDEFFVLGDGADGGGAADWFQHLARKPALSP